MTGGLRLGITIARANWRAVALATACSIAPSRRCTCQSSGWRRLSRWLDIANGNGEIIYCRLSPGCVPSARCQAGPGHLALLVGGDLHQFERAEPAERLPQFLR